MYILPKKRLIINHWHKLKTSCIIDFFDAQSDTFEFWQLFNSIFKYMKAIIKYFEECLHELRQVRWPTQKQAVKISIITSIFVVASSLFIGLLDSFLIKVLPKILDKIF